MSPARLSLSLVALGLSVGLVSACAGGGEPEPAPTVTVTAEPEPAPTVTVTAKPVATTPQSCLDALDAAERLTASVSPALENGGALADLVGRAYAAGFVEGQTGDTSASDAVTAEAGRIAESLGDAMPEFEAAMAAYNDAAQTCRSEG